MNHKRTILPLVIIIIALVAGVYIAQAARTDIPVSDDPLVRMPGTQPGQVSLEASGRCLNCHGNYNQSVEPGYNWAGSMMAQSARDFLFWSCLTVAAQDSIWAAGRPNATDICERCHFPKGWLEGRSDPTNASAMTGADYDGVQCDFCHRMYDPFFELTADGSREGNDWIGYWDEAGTLSSSSALETLAADLQESQKEILFNGDPLYGLDSSDRSVPFSSAYIENGSGQFFVSGDASKRASFADAAARHQMLYSRYHKSKYFCSTCHDVSNPILANLDFAGTTPGDGTTILPSEESAAYSYFHVERTFSEFMLSAYGQQGGASTNLEFQAQGAPGITEAAKCQDCHMRDVVGVACNKNGVPVRPNESAEHPNSGQPLHDLTGGNIWVSSVLASSVPGSANYDAENAQLLNQGPNALTLDLSQGLGIDPNALLAGASRAKQQLLLAATITNLNYDRNQGNLTFQVQNNSGHKLISGFPEGRRMFVNVLAVYPDGSAYEINPYDWSAGTIKGLPGYSAADYQDTDLALPPLPAPAPLGANEVYVDELVYEMHPSSSLTGEMETFHFALADGRYKDNRIPPRGFNISEAPNRLVQPVWHGVDAPDYFTAAEYAGGYDEVSLIIPTGASAIEVNLYYQTTSREYIEFLRDEIDGSGGTLSSPTPAGESDAYVIGTDPFFDQLGAWGDTIWKLWKYNMDWEGAAPVLMADAAWNDVTTCESPVPTLLTAAPGHSEVALSWSDEHTADSTVIGYNLYYDQAGRAQLVQSLGLGTAFTDTGLTNGQEYCYKVATTSATCESSYSNILCAIPENQGQQVPAEIGVDQIETGKWVTVGKGKDKTTTFEITDLFNAGDEIIVRARVVDASTGTPFAGAVVSLLVDGPQAVSLDTGLSQTDGWAEAAWLTEAPNRRGQGGTAPGVYTAIVVGLTSEGFQWNGLMTAAQFTIQ